MKTQTFNIRMYEGKSLKEIDGQLIEKYGVKIILHKAIRPSENGFDWHITEYYTGMCTWHDSKKKNILDSFENHFNDQNLTELGKRDRLDKFNELVKMNIDRYGYANQ